MNFNRIRISEKATYRLSQLKGKTGLTPNILSRIAICYSLNDQTVPNPNDYDERGQELNRYTLTGEWDTFFIALVKERCIHDGLDPEKDLYHQLRAHLNRGVFGMYPQIKGLGDFQILLKHQAEGIKSGMLSEERSHE
ncbi:DNA sulfur modification protein DndE [Methanocalculus alkaliphilus]|uniref:DNA sulfur modification protein DndE n=1 Tax=Methanocalculus alkaliphilus TaxID=768730 RepID=UPI00209EBB5C|nr:DNA sulfur modification protein DndE [Methanocalculus alkaliphilus]MCP1715517.1 DNA sulfur modification protein DndE [Methanocalculus alkaliphilus]